MCSTRLATRRAEPVACPSVPGVTSAASAVAVRVVPPEVLNAPQPGALHRLRRRPKGSDDMTNWTDFLLARIAGDEEAAREFAAVLLTRELEPDSGSITFPFEEAGGPGDPSRVLARCKADRRIVELHQGCGYGTGFCDDGGHGWDDGGCANLALLALPYADHPDYDETWRP